MKVLITGGTGFVGKNFVKSLLNKKQWDIVMVTRNRANIEDFDNGNIKVYEGDVADPSIVERVCAGEKHLDGVIHLAASLIYFSEKEQIRRFNVGGTKNMLKIARQTGASKFIYASSIEAAGGVREEEVPASTNRPPRPISSYGWSKVLAEQEVRNAAKGNFQASILRIGNVYGTDHLNFITFIADSILNRTRMLEFLPYYRDRIMHPVHNQDVTDGILAAYDCQADIVTATLAGEYASVGRIFDICAEVIGHQYHVRDVNKFVDKLYLAVRSQYHRYQGGGGDFITYLMAGKRGDIHRAYSLHELTTIIGYSPKYSIENGIRETLEWAKSAGLISF